MFLVLKVHVVKDLGQKLPHFYSHIFTKRNNIRGVAGWGGEVFKKQMILPRRKGSGLCFLLRPWQDLV